MSEAINPFSGEPLGPLPSLPWHLDPHNTTAPELHVFMAKLSQALKTLLSDPDRVKLSEGLWRTFQYRRQSQISWVPETQGDEQTAASTAIRQILRDCSPSGYKRQAEADAEARTAEIDIPDNLASFWQQAVQLSGDRGFTATRWLGHVLAQSGYRQPQNMDTQLLINYLEEALTVYIMSPTWDFSGDWPW